MVSGTDSFVLIAGSADFVGGVGHLEHTIARGRSV